MSSFFVRRRTHALCIVSTTLGLGLLTSCVANPGPFTMTFHEGSQLTLEDQAGSTAYVLDIGRIACADNVDDDADGLIDFGADPECDSVADGNERIDGVQAFVRGTQPMTIDAAGTMTYEPTQLSLPQPEQCFDLGGSVGIWCLGLTVKGLGGTRTGSIQPNSVNFPITIEIAIDALVGFPDLPADCAIGPIEGTWVADNYDQTTGASHMVANDSSIPATTTCGQWSDGINAFLGLPTVGDAVLETTILDAGGQPVRLD